MHAGEYIEEHAEMFTSWEAKTRYVVDYRIEMHKIEDAIEEVGNIWNDFEAWMLKK